MTLDGVVAESESDSESERTGRSSERDPLPRQVWIGLAILLAWVVVAVFADFFATHDPNEIDPQFRLASPSGDHLLGTDDTGRDVFSRVIHASRVDLRIAFLGALFPAILGTLIGTLAGYYGRWVDAILSGLAAILQAFPVYIFLIALVFALGPGERSILIAFTAISWVIYAKIVRAEVLRVRQTDYIAAARLGGLSDFRIITRHVIPNSIGQVFTYFPSDMVLAMLTLATFSFFGLGIPDPTSEWGSLIQDGRTFIRDKWWLSTVPGFAIASVGIGLTLVGDGLEKWNRER